MKNKAIGAEEKELLRQLMENEDLCRKLDFFYDMNWDIPPAETFMVGEPEPYDGGEL